MSSLITRSHLFDDLLRDINTGFYVRPLHGDPLPSPDKIKIDVKESPELFTVHAELPGVNKNDIKVAVDGNMVTVSAEVKQFDARSRDEKSLREERYFGTVSRSFQLGTEVDEGHASARYENGILTLSLPKKQGTGSRQLKID
ncbi:Hsp20/alpha crystallin family protein [Paucibacter soli]|uniref:Hsp20/alpha crystallin family protein n=1 Tax=Paucibacter soli TaxID=3133433 RepID=UPI0030AE8234